MTATDPAVDLGLPEGTLEAIYTELRVLARLHLARERPDHTLQATALAHEAYLRLLGAGFRWQGRARLLAAAARVVRQVLVDHARRRRRLRHGGAARRLAVDPAGLPAAAPALDVLDLEQALAELARLHARQARLVELRFFGGLTTDEAARVLGVSVRTADGDWQMARCWLRGRLRGME